jgi:2-phospho-L-lactate transferase/gluconeogenesis factor (CofD/UPF0052 family)
VDDRENYVIIVPNGKIQEAKIVVMGSGTGLFVVLSGLKNYTTNMP